MATDDFSSMVATMPKDTAGKNSSPPPAPAICGDIDLRIAADGTWYYHGSPIGRKELVRLFARVLVREADGSFWLVTPVEKARIRVEDAPFLGVELAQEGIGANQTLRLRTNVDDWVVIGPDHPLRIACNPGDAGPKPYVAVRPGLDALIARPVYYELAGLAVKGPGAPAPKPMTPAASFAPGQLVGRHAPPGGSGMAMGVWSAGAFFSLEQAAPRIAPDPNRPGHDHS